MATKSAIQNGDNQPNALSAISGNAAGAWGNFTHFLSDVRAEMRKVVTPTQKEVQATTTVVIVTVFLFGFFFWIVDHIFGWSLQTILHKLGGM
jgi:preprotein translocase subunit SecE